jgi:hypothetical protein
VLRLSASSAVALPWPTAAIISTVNAGAAAVNGRLGHRAIEDLVEPNARASAVEARHIMRSFWSLLPSNVFLVLQGQVLVGVLALTGRTSVLADIGALSRFSVIFGLVSSSALGLLVPVIARSAPDRVAKWYGWAFGIGILLVVVVLAVLIPCAGLLTTTLGQQYGGLDQELVFMLCGSGIGTIGQLLSALNQARGWLKYAWLYVPISTVSTAILLHEMDVSTTRYAAIFTALLPLAGVVAQILPFWHGMRQLQSGQAQDGSGE